MPCLPCSVVRFAPLALVLLFSGCATPVFKDAPANAPTPNDVAAEMERYHDAALVWGGKIIAVDNLEQTTEVQVIGYPLDSAQRPDTRATSLGRFVIVLPGYVEPMDYPAGRYVSVRGHIVGSEVHRIDEHDVVHPQLASDEIHLWPREFPYEHGRFTFGVGVGVGIR